MLRFVWTNIRILRILHIAMERTVNTSLLRRLVRSYGKKGTVIEAAEGIDVSKTLIEQLLSNSYKPTLKEKTRRKICKGFDVDEDQLFPFIAVNEEKAS